MRLTWESKIDSGSAICPDVVFSHWANSTFACRFAFRNESRNALSPARRLSLLSSLRSVIHPSPMASVIVSDRWGFANSNQRRGVTPLVLLLNRSGYISAKSFTVIERNNFEMPRHHGFEPLKRPFFERLRQQGVVRIGQSPLREVPRLIPPELRIVQQNPHELGNGHRWVRVVQLDGDLLGKGVPV